MINKYFWGGLVFGVFAIALIYRMIPLEYHNQVLGICALALISGMWMMGGLLEHDYKQIREIWKIGKMRNKE
jgi:hypothetical protein